MITDKIKSIQDRLKNIAKKSNQDFNSILKLYFHERLLYRISNSKYKNSFILKGGLLLAVFNINSFRQTKDIDFLGKNFSEDEDDILNKFKKMLSSDLSDIDGIEFKTNSITIDKIREDNIYEGMRLKIDGRLGNIKDKIIVDIGFGDIVTPKPLKIEYPVFLDKKPFVLNAYNPETIIAEKLEASCKLGHLTSRMKDFYDIMFLLKNKNIDYAVLEKAINATFKRRKTSKKLYKTILNDDFIKEKQYYWAPFLTKLKQNEKNFFQGCN